MNISELNNGQYIKARFCGVSKREFVKKETGELYVFWSFIVEEQITTQKKSLALSQKAVQEQLHIKMDKPDIIGQTFLFPVFTTASKEYLNYHYLGDEAPILCRDANAVARNAAQAKIA